GSVRQSRIKLYSNGAINKPDSKNTWVRKGDTLTLCWQDRKAPGGAWLDTCKISADGKTFTGRNQIGTAVEGELVVKADAPPAAAARAKEPTGKGAEARAGRPPAD